MNKNLQGLLPIGLLCILVFFMLIFFGSASLEFCGFGVDSCGNLYVGRLHQIEVYDNDIQTRIIIPPAERGWVMTLDDSERIIVSASGFVFTLNTDGTVIDKQEDVHSELYYEICDIRRIEDLERNVYELKYSWIRPTIFKNGSVIYRAPFVDLVARIMFAGGTICFLVGMVAYKIGKQKDDSSFG